MQVSGLTARWFQQDLQAVKQKRLEWEKTIPGHKTKKRTQGPSKLRRAHLVGPSYLCSGGISLSLLCFILEKIYYHRKIRRSRWEAELHGVTIVNRALYQ